MNPGEAMQPELIATGSKLKGTLLVVDDDGGVRRVLTRWIADLGHQVRAAADAEEAIDVMRRGVIDVAVCDVRMPGRDGIWLVDQLRRNYPYTSIVLATGLTEMDPMITLRSGVVGYIVKPFNRDELAEMIQRGLTACSTRVVTPAPQRALPPANDDADTPGAATGAPKRFLTSGVVEGSVLARF
jgi:CheY-like chemotaxis protein